VLVIPLALATVVGKSTLAISLREGILGNAVSNVQYHNENTASTSYQRQQNTLPEPMLRKIPQQQATPENYHHL
jgi:hypothetical protein